MICRGAIHWLGAQTSGNAHRRGAYWRAHKMLATKSGVGPFPLNWLNEAPDVVHRVPPGWRTWLNAFSLRAGAAGWVKPRLTGVRIDAGRTIHGVRPTRDGVILDMENGSRGFDHVLLATGYKINIARLGILGPELVSRIITDDGSPVLSNGYESSVRGLHFVGSSAVKSYGPLLRFVWGAGHAARAVTAHVLANRSGPSAHRARPSAADVFARRTETASQLSCTAPQSS
jgi:hypothetical protein